MGSHGTLASKQARDGRDERDERDKVDIRPIRVLPVSRSYCAHRVFRSRLCLNDPRPWPLL